MPQTSKDFQKANSRLGLVWQMGNGWLGSKVTQHFQPFAKEWITVSRGQQNPSTLQLDLYDKQSYEVLAQKLECSAPDYFLIHLPPSEELKGLLGFLLQSQINSPVIYSSSIGIYYPDQGIVNEKSAVRPGLLNELEALVLQMKNPLIIRWGGLIAPERQLEKYLALKNQIPRPYAPVNLIHTDDCLKLLAHIFQMQSFPTQILNAVTINHLDRLSYYRNLRSQFDFNDLRKGKKVTSLYQLNFT